LEFPRELRQRELPLPLRALATYRQRPALRVDLRDHRQMPAYEKRVVARDRRAEILDRRLEVRRPGGLADERPLARQRLQALLGERAVGKLREAEIRGAADRGGD